LHWPDRNASNAAAALGKGVFLEDHGIVREEVGDI
jgi:hypothetical protein